MKELHLNKLSQGQRRYILERFFSGIFDNSLQVERPKGSIRILKELEITGTDDPKYQVEYVDKWHVRLKLEI